jgi:hypothetical protein
MNNRWLITLLLWASLTPAGAQVCNSSTPATTPTARFTDNGDGTVTDTRTGLMWARCAQGQSWVGGACTGSPSVHTRAQALTAVEGHSFAGHGDWRLPNIKELASIVEQQCYDPAINLAVFPNTPSNWFWSASPYAGASSGYAWGVYFSYGYDFTDLKSYALSVRVVRGGQDLAPLAVVDTPTQPTYTPIPNPPSDD